MKNFEDLLNGVAIRHILSIRNEKSGTYHAIFMIVDILEPDMQDFPSDNYPMDIHRSLSSSGSNEYNAYLTKDYINISKEFLDEPTDNISYKDTKLSFINSDFEHVPSSDKLSLLLSSDETETSILSAILPKRKCSSFVNMYRDKKRKAQSLICEQKNDYLRKQISELTQKYLNFDICRFPELFGNIVFIRHHPVLRDFDIRATHSVPGILIRTSTANNNSCTIKVNVTDRYHNRTYLQHREVTFDAKERMHLIHLDETPNRIDVDVTDKDGSLILSQRNVTFLKSIVVNYSIESVNLVLDKGTKDEKVIPKFNTETFCINGTNDIVKSIIGDDGDSEGYKILEDSLMVAFFDGDKSKAGQAANIQRAHDILQKILNQSHRYLYVVDPYFEAKNLKEFIYPLRSADVQIRILSSKEISVDNAIALQNAIQCYNEQPIVSKIECKLSRGDQPIMHDRYLIAEGNVWLMGCSFNDFGSRATTIVKLPYAAAKRIIDSTDKWWHSEELTCTLNSYAISKEKPI